MGKRIAEYGLRVGEMRRGRGNRLSDVPGVAVGHCTLDSGRSRTGVTVVMPSVSNPFARKLPAAAFVLNGFGKSLGLVQVEELGSLETPIFLTNTLNVGLVHDAAVGYMIDRCEAEGEELRSVNPVVLECNDSSLSDIRERPVREEHVRRAIEAACEDFALGDVGAGKGMTCHGLKGGIGTASRIVELGGREYVLGLLVLANHGRLADLAVAGRPVGREILARRAAGEAGPGDALGDAPDKGSAILVYATDAPLDSRQLGRVLRRGSVGLARLGSYIGHGSGEVFVGFSTANAITVEGDLRQIEAVNESRLDRFFRAAAECAEEAVLDSMACASAVIGWRGNRVESLAEYGDLLEDIVHHP